MKFKHYQTKAKFLTDLGDSKINNDDICYIKDTQEIYTHNQYYRGCLSDYAQNDSTQPDYIKNRTHYVESVTSDVWNQTGCNVGSGTTSPGGYPATFNITTGNKYNVTISQGSTSKTYEGLTAEYDSVFNGLALRKNWSDSMGVSDTSTDALLLVVQPSNVVLRSADIYGENCTVQVSEVIETVHKLDPKYLPDNVNQLDSITTSKSGKVTTVTFEQTNGTETQFQVTDGADGTNGKSAYQVAVDNGYSGTEAQWLASLKGADGVSLGEVELVQQLSQDDDKVPSAKAVQDGIEVWRDDIEYIYRANDLTFDGTNYVDTGWNPYNPEDDFYIKMEISDLDLAGMAASGIIISCVKQASPYPGFVIRKTNNTTINVWLDGVSRWPTTVNTGTGSKNTIIFKRKGDVYTFQVNGGTKNTFTSTANNTSALNLYIGSGLDANNNLWRFGKFHLDLLEIKSLEQSTQLYSDYTKDIKIYPKTTIENVKDLERRLQAIQLNEHCNGIQFRTSFFELTQEQIEMLNSYDECTIRCIMRGDDEGTGGQDWRYVGIGSYDNSTFHIATTYWGMPIVCGRQINSTYNAATLCHPLVWSIVLNKRRGTVRYYRNNELYIEDTADVYKISKFFTDYLYIRGGDQNAIFYDVSVFNTNYIDHIQKADGISFENAIENTSVLGVFKNYELSKNGWFNLTTYKPYGTYTSQTVSGTDIINYHADANKLGSMAGQTAGWGGWSTGAFAAVVEIPFTIDKQIWIQQHRQFFTNEIYDSNGDLIEFDSTYSGKPAKKLEAGNYTLVTYVYEAPSLYMGEYYTAEAGATITIHQRRARYVSAVIHLKCDCIYDKNKVYDDVSNQFYTRYTNSTLSATDELTSSNMPAKYVLNKNSAIPHFVGEIKITGDNIYQANKNYVWKQINNS